MKFEDFNINPHLLSAVSDLKFDSPTEIQEQTIPLLLEHTGDFVGQAQTGTGKTAAFVLPLLEHVDVKSKHIQALILAPTRELAQQVNEEVIKLAKYTDIKTAVIFGGVSYDKQINEIKRNKPSIIVGTPGRIIDLMKRGVLKFSETKKLVVDEADEMLNMGFLEDVQKIMQSLNKEKNIWLFSATMPPAIQSLIKKHFNNIKHVSVKKKTLSNDSIDQYYCILQKKHFAEGFKRVISAETDPYGIIFCETKVETKELAEQLIDAGISAVTLHGDLSQKERDLAMAKFRAKRAQFLVCTDVAARGIDVKNISHVFNFGYPRNHESYVHRIGRTGRAGTKGVAISFITPSQRSNTRRIEKLTRSEIKQLKLPDLQVIKTKTVERELDKLQSLKDSILTRGDEFKIDNTYEVFKDFLKDLDREQALKFLFTMKFNRDFQMLSQYGDLEKLAAADTSRPRTFGRGRPSGRSRDAGGRGRPSRDRSKRPRGKRA